MTHWYCPNCPAEAATAPKSTKFPVHRCPGLMGLMAPLIVRGTKAKVQANEREDYLRDEHAQGIWVDGKFRPIMSVTTVRDDGQDCRVLAPLAVASAEEIL